jgi:uncharacterized protein
MPRTIGIGWIVLGVVMAMLVVPAVLGGIAFVIAGDPEDDVALIAAQAVFAVGLVVVPVVMLRLLRLTPVADRLGVRRFRFWSGIGWMFAAYGIFFAFAVVYGLLVPTETEQQVLQDIAAEKDTAILIAQGILVIAFAPISEEVFFRGFVFGGLRGRMGFWPAAIASGVFFGLIHLLGGSWEVIPPLAAFGVLLAWLYEKTGSIWPSVLMHALQNAIAFAVTVTAG